MEITRPGATGTIAAVLPGASQGATAAATSTVDYSQTINIARSTAIVEPLTPAW